MFVIDYETRNGRESTYYIRTKSEAYNAAKHFGQALFDIGYERLAVSEALSEIICEYYRCEKGFVFEALIWDFFKNLVEKSIYSGASNYSFIHLSHY